MSSAASESSEGATSTADTPTSTSTNRRQPYGQGFLDTISEGWAERFALPPDLPNEATGWGDSSEQVGAFRVDRTVLFGYIEAANRAAVERVTRLTPEQLEQPVVWGTAATPVDTRPAWRALMSICADSLQHLRQINYIRGLVSEPGWFRRIGSTNSTGSQAAT